MNINDFQSPQLPLDWPTALHDIFERQKQLIEKYRVIEQLPAAPISLHHANGQRIIKDFAWRTVEELTESMEAWRKHGTDAAAGTTHALEELADSVHFFVELLIYAGISVEQCLEKLPTFLLPSNRYKRVTGHGEWDFDYPVIYWSPVYELGLAMNFLRNKAWKKSQVPTDEGRCRAGLLQAFVSLMNVWAYLGYSWEDLYSYYFRKSQVNQFRQASNY